jgi:hypothetical protein
MGQDSYGRMRERLEGQRLWEHLSTPDQLPDRSYAPAGPRAYRRSLVAALGLAGSLDQSGAPVGKTTEATGDSGRGGSHSRMFPVPYLTHRCPQVL